MTRLADIFFSFIGLVILLPVLIILSVIISFTSKGGIFFRQTRIGKNATPFKIFKFRTMYIGSDSKGLLTVGGKDSRITPVGFFLRKYKLDELPQLINVLAGSMSLVGPRPEVEKYVKIYTPQQRKVLSVRPGITDCASIEFANENEILAGVPNPEEYYIHHILPQKINLNMKYINNPGIGNYFKILFKTIQKVFSKF